MLVKRQSEVQREMIAKKRLHLNALIDYIDTKNHKLYKSVWPDQKNWQYLSCQLNAQLRMMKMVTP